jgi:hypothetical protein
MCRTIRDERTIVTRSLNIKKTSTSLDLLQHEDLVLRDFFARINETRGSSVESRYDYGNIAKEIIEHVSTRQSCLMDIANALSAIPALQPTAARMADRAKDRRPLIDQLGDLSRSIQGISLNAGQDFDGPLASLIALISPEIEWELSEAIPLIQRSFDHDAEEVTFESASYVTRHAPTHLNLSGRRWYEHAPVVSRLVTIYDHLRDHPRASRDERVS